MSTKNIGRRCFHNCQSLVSISFAPCCSVTSLGEQCFSFSSIAKITIPRSVGELPTDCFRACICLESVAFEEGSVLHLIGNSCFEGCLKLRYFQMPEAVQRINSAAFTGTKISEVAIPSAVVSLGSKCFCIKSLQTISSLCCCGITSIPEACFCESIIRSIEIPAKVLTIKCGAFLGCHHLVNVTFEEGSCLKSIEGRAFSWTGISEIALPDSLQLLDDEVFRGTSLLRVIIPLGLQKLGNKVFANCTQLESVSFADEAAITKIEGQNMFKGTNVREITIPDNVARFNASFLPDGCRVCISAQNKFLFVMIALSTALIVRSLFAVSRAS